MISLKYLQMKKGDDLTKEVVRNFRLGLEKATREIFMEYNRAKREAEALSSVTYLD